MNTKENSSQNLIYEIEIQEKEYKINSYIDQALVEAAEEYASLEMKIEENLSTIKKLTPECDKLDYALAASSGAICGIIDIFLVGKPGESPIGNITDKWFADRTKDFAKLCGWKGAGDTKLSSAIGFLERKFKVPYDQTNLGPAAAIAFDLYPKNHHFSSLAHNPTLLGLFFSILDQFTNSSHFVLDGELIALVDAGDGFVLHGKNIPSKFFCATVNWIGHLISDISGASGSKGRGMGIPSPLWTWMNDVVVIKRKLNINVNEFEKNYNELAIKLFEKGYDVRFQTTQAIPVFVNEMITRSIYTIRRLIRYYSQTPSGERSFSLLWKQCEPFSNASVKRMLTVAHGVFVAVDAGDAVARGVITGGGYFNVIEFSLRLNIVGVGRFAISLYGEGNRALTRYSVSKENEFLEKKKYITKNYIDGLHILAEIYDDSDLLDFINDFQGDDLYEQGFQKTVKLAEKRNVPKEKQLITKSDIDNYFMLGGKKE